jgi:sulfite reductase (ferredoxin)
MDVIALDIDAAKSALNERRLYDAVVASARALLVTRGLEPKKDREVFAAFREHLIDQGWVGGNAKTLLDAAVDFRLGDCDSLADLQSEISALLSRVEMLFGSLDANLNFRAERVEDTESSSGTRDASGQIADLDLRGVACPMNFVRAKIQLEQIDTGKTLDILLDAGEPARSVPASFADQGEEVVSVTNEQTHYRVSVRRRT